MNEREKKIRVGPPEDAISMDHPVRWAWGRFLTQGLVNYNLLEEHERQILWATFVAGWLAGVAHSKVALDQLLKHGHIDPKETVAKKGQLNEA